MTTDFSDAEDKKALVGQLIGLCTAVAFWDGMDLDYPSGAGVFRSDVAQEIAEAAMARLAELEEPNLGLATTRQLLDELTVRIDVDYCVGGGGLDYTTVHGRPDLPAPAALPTIAEGKSA